MHRMFSSSAMRQLGRRLADAGEHDLARRDAGGAGALELAGRNHVGAGTQAGERGDHRLIGIGLDRVADERGHVREGLGEDPVVPLQRRGRIAIKGRADGLGEGREINRLGVKHAVAVGEMMHCPPSVEQPVEREAAVRGPFPPPGDLSADASPPISGLPPSGERGGASCLRLLLGRRPPAAGGGSSAPLRPQPASTTAVQTPITATRRKAGRFTEGSRLPAP